MQTTGPLEEVCGSSSSYSGAPAKAGVATASHNCCTRLAAAAASSSQLILAAGEV